MGTTITLAVLRRRRVAQFGHVGDSRAYLFRDEVADPDHRRPLVRRRDDGGGTDDPGAKPRSTPIAACSPGRSVSNRTSRSTSMDIESRRPGTGYPAVLRRRHRDDRRPGASRRPRHRDDPERRRRSRSSPPPMPPAASTTSPWSSWTPGDQAHSRRCSLVLAAGIAAAGTALVTLTTDGRRSRSTPPPPSVAHLVAFGGLARRSGALGAPGQVDCCSPWRPSSPRSDRSRCSGSIPIWDDCSGGGCCWLRPSRWPSCGSCVRRGVDAAASLPLPVPGGALGLLVLPLLPGMGATRRRHGERLPAVGAGDPR